MTWSKLSDDFSDDCWTLTDAAFRLHVEGLVWSNRKLLDCRIPKDDVRRFASHPEMVTELADVGWWQDEGDAWLIRHHARYQRLKKDVLKQQAANEANGKKGGRPRREQAQDLDEKTQSVSDSVSETETERDRPGQDWQGREGGLKTNDHDKQNPAEAWPEDLRDDPFFASSFVAQDVPVVNPTSNRSCADCGSTDVQAGKARCEHCLPIFLSGGTRRSA
ncbi:hypothetical protein [Branchiibius sp. NY16-3462-2]|uniref:hypothetical protein n=1 Tax=Branchiibius sp. NY16-3462-2 TaxID=1807500 RepID=UPI0007989F24|nr:hypothetical protein [Branchiibius sp. NY16-3462-2]KYH43671.1 hypothetical protein AZH51_02350 [Branchiibius sp. NY16-3462-2]